MSAPSDHSPAMRAAHWATLALIVAAYALGWVLDAPSLKARQDTLFMLHRSVGVTIFVLTAIRLGVRFDTDIPAWPEDMPVWQRFAAKASEVALYILLLVQPVLGIVGSLFYGGIELFGFRVPMLVTPNRDLAKQILEVHGTVALGLLGLIALHAAAALHHHFIRGDEVFARMLPAMRKLRTRRTGGAMR